MNKKHYTKDGLMTFDSATIDSAGAFFIGQLERLDPTLNLPLYSTSWSRDIDIRADISLGDEIASYSLSSFAAAGGPDVSGKAWVGTNTNVLQSVALDIGKYGNPLTPWGMTVSATIPEIVSAMQTGHDIVTEKYDAMQIKLNMDLDQMVYTGDTTLGATGMINSISVTPTNVPNGAAASPLWKNKTPNEILADVNAILTKAWLNSGYAVCPDRLLLPPAQFAYLTSTLISNAGNTSIKTFLEDNSIALTTNGQKLQILPVKWLTGAGAAATDRMVAYTKNSKFLRFPKTDIVPAPLEYRGLAQYVPYWGRIGFVEVRYAETMAYADGI